MSTTRRSSALALALTALASGLVLLLSAAPASAHGDGEEAIPARALVLTALTYLANQPPDFMEGAADKMSDALESEDTQGVDLDRVAAAQTALERNDMMAARQLLQSSIEPLTSLATGDDAGTTVVLDPMAGHTDWKWSGVLLGALSVAAILVGTTLAWRLRPAMNLRALRARAGMPPLYARGARGGRTT